MSVSRWNALTIAPTATNRQENRAEDHMVNQNHRIRSAAFHGSVTF